MKIAVIFTDPTDYCLKMVQSWDGKLTYFWSAQGLLGVLLHRNSRRAAATTS